MSVTYSVETAALSVPERTRLCGLVVSALAADVERFETDLPWWAAAEWPDEVLGAGQRLCAIASHPPEGEGGYGSTGVHRVTDGEALDDFVTFAPYAMDASAWSAGHTQVLALSDCSDAIVVRLSPDQRQTVLAIAGSRLVEHRRRRRWRSRR